MMGLFGRKKDDKPADAKPAEAAASQPAPETANSEDMFGGLTSGGTRRRKRGAANVVPDSVAETSAPELAESAAPPLTEQQTSEPQPFFAKFEYHQTRATEDEFESDEVSQLRERLERFYTEYNPSKLSQIESTIKTYKDRVPELFKLLTEKYGPEPADPKAKTSTTAAAPNSNSIGFVFSTSDDLPKESGWTTGVGNDAPASGFQFSDASETGTQGLPASSTGAGFSFGGVDDGGAAAGGFKFGSETAADGADHAAGVHPSGFTFGADPTDNTEHSTGFTFSGASDAPASGFAFGESSAPEDAAVSGFVFESSQEGAGGFTFSSNGDEGVGLADHTCGPLIRDTAPSIEQDAAANTKSETDDDDDTPTMNERHRKELSNAEGAVYDAKLRLAALIADLASNVVKRQTAVDDFRHIEQEIEDCIQTEAFEKADQLNTSLERIGRDLDLLDASETEIQETVPKTLNDIRVSCRDLGALLRKQRQELLEGKEEEERRVNKFITETSSKLDSQLEKLAASLDRANRTLHNTEQEVINIEQRSQKIQERIQDQTKGLRQSLSVLVTEKDTLDAEIKELEAKLQQKRRLAAEKKMKIGELEEKLKIIMDDFAVTVDEVERQLRDEEKKRHNAQLAVDDLTEQEQLLLREQSDFAEERESMLRTLEQNSKKIERYSELAVELSGVAPDGISAYVDGVLFSLLRARSAGKTFLVESPHHDLAVADSNSASSSTCASPVRVLTQLEASLRRCQKEQQLAQAEETSMKLRLQDIRKSIPLLEAAKKAAALSKQFKEAQQKTEELKKLLEESTVCEEGATQARKKIESIEDEIARLMVEIQAERQRVTRFMKTFLEEYQTALVSSASCVDSVELNILRDDTFDMESDALRTSLKDLIVALEQEAQRLISTALPDASGRSTPEADSLCLASAGPPAANITEVSELGENEMREKIVALETLLAAAVDQEDYAQCEALQNEIDDLQSKLLQK